MHVLLESYINSDMQALESFLTPDPVQSWLSTTVQAIRIAVCYLTVFRVGCFVYMHVAASCACLVSLKTRVARFPWLILGPLEFRAAWLPSGAAAVLTAALTEALTVQENNSWTSSSGSKTRQDSLNPLLLCTHSLKKDCAVLGTRKLVVTALALIAASVRKMENAAVNLATEVDCQAPRMLVPIYCKLKVTFSNVFWLLLVWMKNSGGPVIIPRRCGCGLCIKLDALFLGVLRLVQRAVDRYTVKGCLIGTLRVNEVNLVALLLQFPIRWGVSFVLVGLGFGFSEGSLCSSERTML